jgi:micrococcal nuclease
VAATVVNVIDGDTIDVFIQGRVYRVRYIGIDTPETVHPTRGVEPYGIEASNRNKELVAGKTVYLEKDVSEVDRYGRLLRYVWLEDEKMVNALLVAEGFAQVATYPPDVKYVERFLVLQSQAKAAGLGLWSGVSITGSVAVTVGRATATPVGQPVQPVVASATPTRTPTPPSPGNCHPSYPTVCIPPPPPDLDCGEIPYRRFTVLPPDPHRFDGDRDGLGCE